MAQALDAAWTRSIEAAEASGRQRRVEAEHRIADNWFAAPPALSMSQREGQGAAADSSRETEVGVAFPLWRLGQRQRNLASAQAESEWAAAAERAARLRLAAQLRDQLGQLQSANSQVQQAMRQRQIFEALTADVERRVRAGDLAPADALAAQADLIAARALEREAQQALDAQHSIWLTLTGFSAIPEPESLPESWRDDTVLEQHAEARLAEAALQRARQRLAQTQARRDPPPELGIGVRQERPGPGQGHQNSMALSLRVPFGTDTHSQPAIATAWAEQEVAFTAQQRTHRQLKADLQLARQQLAHSEAQATLGQEHVALLRQRADLIGRSFQAGESPLPELLRALSATAQAEAASARQQANLTQARARLLQSLGLLP